MKRAISRWQANFVTGLAIILPAVITLALVRWLFGTVANVTDMLLIFLPQSWTQERAGEGPMVWYWSLLALALAILLTALLGRSARYFVGKKLIEMVDLSLLRIPLLNKIYGAIKQVNQAFSSNQKTAFKQVVLVEFPHPRTRSIGFLTGEDYPELDQKTGEKMVCVFVPTTPIPTGGFLLMVSERDIVKLDMSVADGIKFIISLGAIAPDRPILPHNPLPVDPLGHHEKGA